MMDDNVLSGAMRAVDEALTEMQRPAAPTREPEPAGSPAVTPIDVHIAELHEAMVRHNAAIETAQMSYAADVNASRSRLEAAQNELRAAERELAARWHGEPT